MTDQVRPYLFYDFTTGICSTCFMKCEAKTVFEDGRVFLLKRCFAHGPEKVLVADDVEYYRRCRETFIKPPEMPERYNTGVKWGCPYDCGLCSDHEQHSCLTLVEITDQCNLRCPTCYASSGPERQTHRSLEHIERMLDAVVASEGKPDVVQISGGEPTIHPQFWQVLDAAKRRPIKHLMLNTNGVRIAQDPAFARRLATYQPGFEVYLQFDSLEEAPLRDLRAEDLRDVRRKALANLEAAGVSTNLVVVVKKGLNDGELGRIVEHALSFSCVRGVTFQPVQHAGRTDAYDPATQRLTLTEVRRRILEQSSRFAPEDIIPVPCHPDALAMAYALKLPAPDGDGQMVVPLTGLIDPKVLIEGRRNTIVYEHDAEVKDAIFRLFSTNHSPESSTQTLKDLLCCLPQATDAKGPGGLALTYQNLFRIIIMQFADAHAFDVRSLKKSCVTIVHPDGRLIPFDTYNLLYRDDLERTRLAPLRAAEERRWLPMAAPTATPAMALVPPPARTHGGGGA